MNSEKSPRDESVTQSLSFLDVHNIVVCALNAEANLSAI